VELYDALVVLTGSPVAEVNRALALAEVEGAAAGLDALPAVEADARLREYQPYWAARADLLARTGKKVEARHAYDVAIGLEADPAVKRFLEERARRLVGELAS
jgi:RNA polymerase sigma-70 factor (ECF subfamily)